MFDFIIHLDILMSLGTCEVIKVLHGRLTYHFKYYKNRKVDFYLKQNSGNAS